MGIPVETTVEKVGGRLQTSFSRTSQVAFVLFLALISCPALNAQSTGNSQMGRASAGSTPAPLLKSRCLSGICIGDDIAKIAFAKTAWVPMTSVKEAIDRYTRNLAYGRGAQTGQTAKSRMPKNTREMELVSQVFRNLSESEATTLALHFGTSRPFSTSGHEIFDANNPGLRGISVTTESIALLKKATVCALLPVLGMFRSESGYDTTVLMLPENGKYVVVGLHRFFEFKVPANATPQQSDSLYFEMYKALVDRLNESFGDYFIPTARNSYYAGAPITTVGTVVTSDPDAIAYLDPNDVKEPVFALLKQSFARFDLNRRPLTDTEQRNRNLLGLSNQTVSNGVIHSFDQKQNYYSLDWEQVILYLNQTLASSPACQVTTKKVTVD